MFNSEKKQKEKTYNRRAILLLLGKFSLFSIIGYKLFNLQILQSNKYKTLSKKNQISFKIIYPIRGKIYDRNKIVIATNQNTYDLFLIPDQTNNIEETLNKLSKYILIDFKTKRKVIDLSKKINKFQSIKILENISWESLEIIESNKFELPGLNLQLVPKRTYPYNKYFSHILGYTNKPSEKDLSLPFISNMLSLDIGKSGVEKMLNENLIGYPGKREVEINAFGKEIREVAITKSKKGKDAIISIDTRVQKYAYEQINKNRAGSIVVMDIYSGEIISMVSIPDFNPNLIIKKPNTNYWNEILSNPLSPLTNRSLQGLYSPGSTFKMMVALAGLNKGVLNINDSVNCEGKINFGDRPYHCWKIKGHGKTSLIKAIKESCDVYFYELSLKIGIDGIAKIAKEFGMGEITQIGFDFEKKGIIPSKKWKKNFLNESWYPGETLISGIGQGYVLSTPLQLAVMTSRIANNGIKVKPTILKQSYEKKFNKININSEFIDIIKKGMFEVVNEVGGTAFKSKSSIKTYSGKTGTSQVKKISIEERESEDFRKVDKEWKEKDHALFVGYMPSDRPKYAISVVIEHGGSGASVAAPIAKNIFNYLSEIYKI